MKYFMEASAEYMKLIYQYKFVCMCLHWFELHENNLKLRGACNHYPRKNERERTIIIIIVVLKMEQFSDGNIFFR